MHAPTPTQLLDLWDAGERATPWGRAALLLDCAWPEAASRNWSLGMVNASLLELRAVLFGPMWECVADCPTCAQTAEVPLDIPAMLAAAPTADQIQTAVRLARDAGEAADNFRLPVLEDLVSTCQPNVPAATRLLQAVAGATDAAVTTIDADVLSARSVIGRQVLQLDPLAAIDIIMDCPGCGNRWRAAADVIGMLWAELSLMAKRLLTDIARLASVFGWSEPQILALSPMRRAHYLALVREW